MVVNEYMEDQQVPYYKDNVEVTETVEIIEEIIEEPFEPTLVQLRTSSVPDITQSLENKVEKQEIEEKGFRSRINKWFQ